MDIESNPILVIIAGPVILFAILFFWATVRNDGIIPNQEKGSLLFKSSSEIMIACFMFWCALSPTVYGHLVSTGHLQPFLGVASAAIFIGEFYRIVDLLKKKPKRKSK